MALRFQKDSLRPGFAESDIDLFVYGLNEREARLKILEILQAIYDCGGAG